MIYCIILYGYVDKLMRNQRSNQIVLSNIDKQHKAKSDNEYQQSQQLHLTRRSVEKRSTC